MKHDFYMTYDELTAFLKSTEADHPAFTKLSSIGQTELGRDMWLLTVTDLSTGAPELKPAVWVDGNTHATELAGCQACVHLIDHLTSESRMPSSRVAQILKDNTFYILPRISADGAEEALRGTHHFRSSPVPFPGDQPKENFKRKDINGDGELLQMRIQDPSGFFKCSTQDPRVMIPRAPFDSLECDGPFYHVFPEGEFENFDGFHRRDLASARFDLNRQSPAQFSPREEGAGPLPLFLKEAQALARAIIERPNIVSVLTHHTFGGLLLRPSSLRADSDLPVGDLAVYKLMGQIGEQLTGYKALSVYHDFRYHPKEVTTGAWDDWHYDHRGIFSWTSEIWNLPAQAGIQYQNAMQIYDNPGDENLVQVLKWCDTNLEPGSYFREWTPFDHPQLGAIEIGGWRTLFTWKNPPREKLESEISKLTPFALRLAQMNPKVVIKKIRKQRIAADVYHLQVQVQNQGYLPTHVSDCARNLKIHQTPQVKLKLAEGQKLLQGKTEMSIRHLSGRARTENRNSSIWGNPLENSHEDQFEWVLQGPGRIQISVAYHGAGVLHSEIEIGLEK